MDNRGKRQASSIFGGMGFYIALLVCVLAAGVVGYFALLNNNNTAAPEEDPVQSVADPGPTQSVSSNREDPVQSVMSEEPVTVQTPLPRPVSKPEPEPPSAGETAAPVVEPEPIQEEPMTVVAPLNGETVSVFSIDHLTYDPTLGDWRTHDGIDIRASAGTEVVAAASGTVLSVEKDGRLGTTIVIEHPDGHTTTYGSLQQEVSVLAGDQVEAGQVIGGVGNTSLSEAGLGAHLHFSVTRDGVSVDPAAYLNGGETGQ